MAINNRVKSTNDLELKDRLVAINRVTKVTKGGRTFSFAAIVVVGNENGIVGWGLGKASEVTTAISKGTESAKKNLVRIPIHKGTIPHEQAAKFGGAEVLIKPATLGTGVKAGGAMRAVLESVGITDVLAKSKGSSNPHNLVKATIAALSELRSLRRRYSSQYLRISPLHWEFRFPLRHSRTIVSVPYRGHVPVLGGDALCDRPGRGDSGRDRDVAVGA